MVIQRWQSVALFIAALMMILFLVFPAVEVTSADGGVSVFKPIQIWGLAIPVSLTGISYLTSIFLFKAFKPQRLFVALANGLAIVSLCLEAFFVYTITDGQVSSVINWLTAWLPLGAFVAGRIAAAMIARDHKLLSSYDRLR